MEAAVHASPYLTDAEIAEICEPLVAPAAQRRYLAKLGMLVQAKPNGRPLVARSEFERVLGAGRFAQQGQNAPTRGQPNQAAGCWIRWLSSPVPKQTVNATARASPSWLVNRGSSRPVRRE